MPPDRMTLKILLPFQSFLEKNGVRSIVADTSGGSLGLLPHRLDCVAALRPGILSYAVDGEAEAFVAVDEGVLIKTGTDVFVSVRGATGGTDLGRLRQAVQQEFLAEDAAENSMRAVMAKIETGLLSRLKHYQHD
jgi:F-type H+-transporting ATPase subunit epsilon